MVFCLERIEIKNNELTLPAVLRLVVVIHHAGECYQKIQEASCPVTFRQSELKGTSHPFCDSFTKYLLQIMCCSVNQKCPNLGVPSKLVVAAGSGFGEPIGGDLPPYCLGALMGTLCGRRRHLSDLLLNQGPDSLWSLKIL